MTPILEATGLLKTFVLSRNAFGRPRRTMLAVKGVDLHVQPGETLGVVGESGAGKSTVGRILLRLVEPDEGTLRFKGDDVRAYNARQLRAFRAHARMIFQDPYSSLDPTMTIADAVAEPLRIHHDLSRAESRERVVDLLRRVGLGAHQMDRRPYEFSGGQLQRVAVARAVATRPDVIVCDEPVAALDMSIRSQVINLLLDMQAEHGQAYVFISHDLSLVGHIAQRVAVMYRGRVVETGSCDELFAEPRHPYTRSLFASIPRADPRQRRPRADAASRPMSGQQDLAGCDYADRCPHAISVCWSTPPPVATVGGLTVACHLYEPDAVVETAGLQVTRASRIDTVQPHL